jgi:hypothetical protein
MANPSNVNKRRVAKGMSADTTAGGKVYDPSSCLPIWGPDTRKKDIAANCPLLFDGTLPQTAENKVGDPITKVLPLDPHLHKPWLWITPNPGILDKKGVASTLLIILFPACIEAITLKRPDIPPTDDTTPNEAETGVQDSRATNVTNDW